MKENDTHTLRETRYTDLGLPSGTLWSDRIAVIDRRPLFAPDYYPTKRDFDELQSHCEWTWEEGLLAWKVTGPNGRSITVPAFGTPLGKDDGEGVFTGRYACRGIRPVTRIKSKAEIGEGSVVVKKTALLPVLHNWKPKKR